MNMTASTGQARIEAPSVAYGGVAPRRGADRPPQPSYTQKRAKKGEGMDQHAQRMNGTARQLDDEGLGWTINTRISGQETKTTRNILDMIDAGTLRAARSRGGVKRQIAANRDRIEALLGLCEEWKQPDEVYADEAWEICIVWRSGYGKVEIGTEEDGSIGYYVSRTLSDKSEEGNFREHSREEIDRIMSWLNKKPEEI